MSKPVTLVCIDTIEHKLAKLAVEKCIARFDFADVVIISDKEMGIPGARWVYSTMRTEDELAQLLWSVPLEIANTPHTLFMQYDGWIINPRLWTDDFLRYDYIGAPWYWTDWTVGNGGFSLRSARLTEALVAEKAAIGHPEDAYLARIMRPRLEKYGVCWAEPKLAMQFSLENAPLADASFGFHGAFMVRYLLGDAYEEWLLQSSGHFLKNHALPARDAERFLRSSTAIG